MLLLLAVVVEKLRHGHILKTRKSLSFVVKYFFSKWTGRMIVWKAYTIVSIDSLIFVIGINPWMKFVHGCRTTMFSVVSWPKQQNVALLPENHIIVVCVITEYFM